MNFRTNLDKLVLIGNLPIKVYFENKTVEINPPNIKLLLMDKDFELFISILRYDVEDFYKIIGKDVVVVKDKYEVLLAILKLDTTTKSNIIKYLKIVFPNLEYKNSALYCEDQVLNSEEYKIILDCLFISCGEKDLNTLVGTNQKEVKKPVNAKAAELEEKIRKAKEKKNSKKETKNTSSTPSTITIDQIVIGLLYEFKSMRIEDIYNLNMFGLLELWAYVSKIVDTQIQIVAAGNGNIKKFTYFIN